MKKILIIKMPYEGVVSVNRAYGKAFETRRVYLKKKAKSWKQEAILKIQNQLQLQDWEFGPNIVIELTARFPQSTGRKPDADNFLKLFQDAVGEALGMDDHTFKSRVKNFEHRSENPGLIYEVWEDV